MKILFNLLIISVLIWTYLKINLSYCQQYGFHGGANYGRLYVFGTGEPPASSNFEAELGFLMNISINEFKLGLLRKATLSIGYERIGGYFSTGYSGLGGGSWTNGTFHKHLLDMELYPWNIHFLKNMIFSPGFEINATLASKINGTHEEYAMGTSIPDVDLSEEKHFVGPFNVGINLNLGYEMNCKNFKIKPSYKFATSLLPELGLENYAPSMRHSLLIGIIYNVKTK